MGAGKSCVSGYWNHDLATKQSNAQFRSVAIFLTNDCCVKTEEHLGELPANRKFSLNRIKCPDCRRYVRFAVNERIGLLSPVEIPQCSQ